MKEKPIGKRKISKNGSLKRLIKSKIKFGLNDFDIDFTKSIEEQNKAILPGLEDTAKKVLNDINSGRNVDRFELKETGVKREFKNKKGYDRPFEVITLTVSYIDKKMLTSTNKQAKQNSFGIKL